MSTFANVKVTSVNRMHLHLITTIHEVLKYTISTEIWNGNPNNYRNSVFL